MLAAIRRASSRVSCFIDARFRAHHSCLRLFELCSHCHRRIRERTISFSTSLFSLNDERTRTLADQKPIRSRFELMLSGALIGLP